LHPKSDLIWKLFGFWVFSGVKKMGFNARYCTATTVYSEHKLVKKRGFA